MLKKLNNSLACAFDNDLDNIKKLPLNEVVEVEIKRKRNIKFHKKFFALINLVFQNQEVYTNIEHLRKDLIIASGHYELRHNIEGLEIAEAKSISFSNMDETEFNDLYNSVVDTICKHFHFDKQQLIDEVAQYF